MASTRPPEARAWGALKRQGKRDIVILFWILVLARAACVAFTIAGFQRLFHLMAGKMVARSFFFFPRSVGPFFFSQDVASFAKSCSQRAMEVP